MERRKMPIRDPENVNWFTYVILFFVTAVGSVARYLHRIDKGQEFSLISLIAHISLSGFAGLLIVLLASHFEWGFEWTGVACGIAGWSSSATIRVIEDRVLKGINSHDKK